jgi:hypothetical protein
MDKKTFIENRSADLIDDHVCNDDVVFDMAFMIASLEWEVSTMEKLVLESDERADYWEEKYRDVT